MSKNSDTMHRVAATFQAGRDPSQDAIINWLNTLAKNERSQLHRSVLKYHLTQALLMYIPQAAMSTGSRALPVTPVVPSLHPGIAIVSDSTFIALEATPRPLLAGGSSSSVESHESSNLPKSGGGVLRSRLKMSMGTPKY
jgi:hypothetical protein